VRGGRAFDGEHRGEPPVRRGSNTDVTRKLAEKMARRAKAAGIEIALIDARGNVFDVKPAPLNTSDDG
jgi:hypothetical protein